jgi:hypothetical protein
MSININGNMKRMIRWLPRPSPATIPHIKSDSGYDDLLIKKYKKIATNKEFNAYTSVMIACDQTN